MTFSGDVARLKKFTREVLLREVLREIQGDAKAVVDAIDHYRFCLTWTDAELEHYALMDDCQCDLCARFSRFAPTPMPSSAASRTGEAWVTEMIRLIEKRAPGLTAAALRMSIAMGREFESRTEEELQHFARHGYFASHSEEPSPG